jgi:hypothetical protein
MKDVVMVGGYQEVEVDFTADNPGLTLFHCHQQLHMDFGFMTLFDYVIPHLCTDLNGWRKAEGVNPLGPLEIL